MIYLRRNLVVEYLSKGGGDLATPAAGMSQ
ncbi:hypothetical protein DSM117340_03284 [Lentibacter algarum]